MRTTTAVEFARPTLLELGAGRRVSGSDVRRIGRVGVCVFLRGGREGGRAGERGGDGKGERRAVPRSCGLEISDLSALRPAISL